MISVLSQGHSNETTLLQSVEERERILCKREFILSQTQKLAKTGSWDFDRILRRTTWSEEMYNIHELSTDFDPNDFLAILALYEENSRVLIMDAVETLYKSKRSFDIVARIITPVGYKKWVRVVAHPTFSNGEVSGIIGITSDITTLRESEEIIRESEEKFASAFRNSPDVMVITREHDLLIVDVNENVFQVLGYTREELRGKRSSEFKFYFDPDDRVNFFAQYEQIGHAELECPWIKKSGEMVHVLISSNRLQLKGVNYFVTVIKDISARKLAEEKFQKVFHLSPDLMVVVRISDQKVIEVNHKVSEICGYGHDELIGQSTADLDLWVDKGERDQFLKILRSEGHASTVALFKKKNRTTFHGSITSKVIELNSEAHFVCVIRDITTYKNAENIIRQNEVNLNAIINNTDMDIWSVDSDLRIIAVNDNFRNNVKRLYGVDLNVRSDMKATFRDKLPDEKFAMWLDLYMAALGGASVSIQDKRDDQILNYALQPISEGNTIVGVVGYAKNITEILCKEEALEIAGKKIAELQLSTLRAFMDPHFIFNALNSIQYFISKSEREKAIQYLSTFSGLIRKVLVNSQSDCVSLGDELDLLQDYVAIERLRFDQQFDFQIHVNDNVSLSHIKLPSLLIQPFVENAINHGFTSLDRRGQIDVSISKEDSFLFIEVTDNGIGRAAAAQQRWTSGLQRESSGIAITSERLRLINKNNQVSIEYEDLEESGSASGTRVIIKVKIGKCNKQ